MSCTTRTARPVRIAVDRIARPPRARVRPWMLLGLAGLVWGCGGREFRGRDAGLDLSGQDTRAGDRLVVDGPDPVDVVRPDVQTRDVTITDSVGPDVVPPGRVPLNHRPTATPCDRERPPVNASPEI